MTNRQTLHKIALIALLVSAVLVTGVGAALALNSEPIPLSLRGNSRQSGVIIGKTLPLAIVQIDEIIFNADSEGNFVIGFDRDAPLNSTLIINAPNHREMIKTLNIARRQYLVRRVNGLPAATLNPPASAKAKIAEDTAIKQAAWASLDTDARGFLENFRWPINSVRVTSPWGAVRRLNGTLGRPHYGVDLGAAKGTPILAPASGKIVIAETGLFFEGGLVGIDHGQGLISYTMHMSRVSVAAGQLVQRGDKVGEVGSTGRSTGPHLHWSLRWRGRQLDPQLMVGGLRVVE